MKRFWQTVTVTRDGDDHGVALDARPIRTPGRLPLTLPTPQLAEAIADEWRSVEGEVDPRAMPLTGLANAAIDRIAPDPLAFAAGLARYAASDLLCYRTEDDGPLLERQRTAWDPLLAWARDRYDIHFAVTQGVMPVAQPPATLARLDEAVAARPAFELAALSPIVTVTGSLVAALALAEGAQDAATIWRAARVDQDWQEELWGLDPLSEAATAAHRADFDAGARFLTLL